MKKQAVCCLCLLSMLGLGACSTGDDDLNDNAVLMPQSAEFQSTSDSIVFKGTYTAETVHSVVYPVDPSKVYYDLGVYYSINTDFRLVMTTDSLKFDRPLIKMLTDYQSDNDISALAYRLTGYSADNQMKVYQLDVPPFEYDVDATNPLHVRLEFNFSEAQAVYDDYTGEISLWLPIAKEYYNGELHNGERNHFLLTAHRVSE